MGLEFLWKFQYMWLLQIEIFSEIFDEDFEVKMEVKVCVFLLNKQSILLLDYFQKCFFWLCLKKIVVWFLCYRENFLEVRKSNKLDCEVLKYIIFEEMG